VFVKGAGYGDMRCMNKPKQLQLFSLSSEGIRMVLRLASESVILPLEIMEFSGYIFTFTTVVYGLDV